MVTMRRTPLNKISLKRILQAEEELPARRAVCERAGGVFRVIPVGAVRIERGRLVRRTLYMSYCLGGYCEKCGEKPDWRGLSFHERKFRSQGGEVSIQNTVAVCGKCHSENHGIKEV